MIVFLSTDYAIDLDLAIGRVSLILLHFSIDNAMQLCLFFDRDRRALSPAFLSKNDISDRRVSYLWPLCLIDHPFLQNVLYSYLDGEMIDTCSRVKSRLISTILF